MNKTLPVALSSLFLSFTLASAIMAQGKAEERLSPGGVGVAGHAISMPVGYVLLIKRVNFVGCVIFLYNERRKDGTNSKYEYFEFEKEKGFQKVREGVISLKDPRHGFWANLKGMFVHFPAGDVIKFKNFSLFAHPNEGNHSAVYFWNPIQVDLDLMMAPSPWKEIAEVNLSDPRIIWFTYDDKREWKVIPIDKIWE